MKRRKFFEQAVITGVGAAALGSSRDHTKVLTPTNEKRFQNGRSPWPICLDTATIRNAGNLSKKIDIAIEAGYDAIEPWDSDLVQYEEEGGDLKELAKKITDHGLFVPSMIGLWGCLPDSEDAFKESLAATRNRLRMASEIGSEFAQAIPNSVGANYDGRFVASCYRRLLEIGINDYNVKPALVFVEMFPLKTLGQAVAIALDSDHPEARIIPDVFHMYISKGGFEGLKQLNGDMFAIFQFNDAPKGMALEEMKDKDRVYPGDGILPLPKILKDLKKTGFNRCISLELYNPSYYERDPLQVAREGLSKTLSIIDEAKI